MRAPRLFEAIVSLALIFIALGGALLYVRIEQAVTANRHFICAFGSAISEQPLKRREAETLEEFQQRVKSTKGFVRDLEAELADCDVPTVIVLDPESKDELREERRQREERERRQQERRAEGGDAGSPQNQGNGQPGGSNAPDLPDIDLPNPTGPSTPSSPPSPVPPPVKEPLCELWQDVMPPVIEDPVQPLVCP